MPMPPPSEAIPAAAAAAPRNKSEAFQMSWLATAVFGLFWLELTWRLQMEWSINPQYGYGWTVPFLAAFLFWRRWKNAPAPSKPGQRWLPIVCMIAAALVVLPVRLIQEANPDWRLMSWAMALATALITLAGIYLAGGWRWLRYFSFPVLFFLVAVPWPMQIEQFVIQGLMRADAAINVEILNAIGVPAVQLGNVIEVGTGFVGIDEACTGVRSLQATFMVSLFLGEFYGFTVFRRAILIASGAALAFFCNLVRTFLLVWLGAEHGLETIKRWHDPAGYSILFACLLGLWLLSLVLESKGAAIPQHHPDRGRAFCIPRFALAVLLLLIVSAEGATQIWYGLHESAAANTPSWTVEWPTGARDYQAVPVAESAQELLRYNEGGGGAWNSSDGHRWGMYFFRWLPGRTAGLFIKNHRPDICLPASGMVQRGSAQDAVVLIKNIALPMRGYEFENKGQLLHVYYCYWDGTSPERGSNTQENWTASGRMRAVFAGKRDVGTQMLEIIVAGYVDAAAAGEAVRAQLNEIIRPI